MNNSEINVYLALSLKQFVPELSLVAVENEQVIGHILVSPIFIETEQGRMSTLGLDPMTVNPK